MLRQFDSVSGRLLLIGVCLRKLVVNGDFIYVNFKLFFLIFNDNYHTF